MRGGDIKPEEWGQGLISDFITIFSLIRMRPHLLISAEIEKNAFFWYILLIDVQASNSISTA